MDVPTTMLRPDRSPQKGAFAYDPERSVSGPLVSCLMVTRGDADPARFAIDCYRRQTYRDRELVIVCDRPDSAVAALVAAAGDPTIHYVQTSPASLGELRNVSIAHARGVLVCQWDDDDLYDRDRIALQAAALVAHDVAAIFLQRWLLWWPARRVLAISGSRTWEGSLLARRDSLPIYPARAIAEDNITVARLCAARPVLLVDRPDLYVYIVHGRNSYQQAHFEAMIGWASRVAPPQLYDADLSALAARFPIGDYAGTMAPAP